MNTTQAKLFLPVAFAVWVLVIFGVFYWLGFDKVAAAIANADLGLIAAAFGLVILARVTYVMNLRILLYFFKTRVPLSGLFQDCFAGFFVDDILPTVLPLGEMTTAYLLNKRGVSFPKAIAAVVAQVISWFAGFVLLFVLVLAGLIMTGAMPHELFVVALVPFIIFCLFLFVLFVFAVDRKACEALVCRLFGGCAYFITRFTRYKHLSRHETHAFLVSTVRRFHDSICPFLEKHWLLLVSFAFLFVHHFLGAYAFFLVLQAFHVNISMLMAFFIFLTVSLVSLITFVPGGLGVYEAVSITLLSIPGGPVLAVVATSVFRLIEYWFIVFTGGLAAVKIGLETLAKPVLKKKQKALKK